MANKIIHKHSSVVTDGNVKLPTSSQLEYGELAVNYAKDNETISLKNSENKIVEFKSKDYFDEKMNKINTILDNYTTNAAFTEHTSALGKAGAIGHVKIIIGDVNGKTYKEGEAAAAAHDHSNYLTSQSISHLATKDELSGYTTNAEFTGYTGTTKTTLEGLRTDVDKKALKNDLTTLSGTVSTLRNDFNTLVSGNTDTVIESFKEVTAFLSGVTDTQSLDGIIGGISSDIDTHKKVSGGTGTTEFGHVKIITGDVNGKTYTKGEAAAAAHTHGNYSPSSHTHDDIYLHLSGTATNATNVYVKPNSSNATHYLTFASGNTSGNKALGIDSDLTYNPSSNTLTTRVIKGAIVSGTNVYGATSVTGTTVKGTTVSGTNVYGAINVIGTIVKGTTVSGTNVYGATSVTGATVSGTELYGNSIYKNETELDDLYSPLGHSHSMSAITSGTITLSGQVNGTVTYNGTNGISANTILKTAGSATQPVYITSGGVICACTAYSGASVSSATNATNVNVTSNSTNTTHYLTFASGNTSGNKALRYDSNLTYNPSSNTLTAGVVKGTTVSGTELYGNSIYKNETELDDLYSPLGHSHSNYSTTDTKNTAGSTNSTSKLFLIGSTSQTGSSQTYSNSKCYTQSDYLYSNGEKVDMRLTTALVPIGTSIPLDTDLNTITYLKVGKYCCSANDTVKTLVNCPTQNAFIMEVYSLLSTTIDNESTTAWCYRLRRLTTYVGNEYIQFCRSDGSKVWTYNSWQLIPKSNVSGTTLSIGSATQPVYIDSMGILQSCTSYSSASVSSATNATNVYVTSNSTNTVHYLTFASGNTNGNKALRYDSNLSYNPSSNTLTVYAGTINTSKISASTITASTSMYSAAFYETSDERLKNFQNKIPVDLDKLSKLKKNYFTWKEKERGEKLEIGVSAQEIKELYPEIVSDEGEILSVAYDKLSVVALSAVDVLYKENKSLKNKVSELEEQIKNINEFIQTLKK